MRVILISTYELGHQPFGLVSPAAWLRRAGAAVLAVDDSGALLAVRASTALGLPHNSLASAEAARDKHLMRRLFARGVPSPPFRLCSTGDDPHSAWRACLRVRHPFTPRWCPSPLL